MNHHIFSDTDGAVSPPSLPSLVRGLPVRPPRSAPHAHRTPVRPPPRRAVMILPLNGRRPPQTPFAAMKFHVTKKEVTRAQSASLHWHVNIRRTEAPPLQLSSFGFVPSVPRPRFQPTRPASDLGLVLSLTKERIGLFPNER